ncbi:short chain dehydrogenase family protein [Synechococcus sp. MEDNS5]|uniref:SDR family NAD(P)-dependent oxidoreductase n=1 Tax=Synechococcus sp. MEDNS5 TaxID=1442554 RepID=UPI001647530D|nr:SDR family NAD(P)-dependent oxidoreductase [Synechococcus sp. MEDNS5]QNJ05719.1 short chain dehydrogenase family protein [Synechococcus sp. MEDNS5]
MTTPGTVLITGASSGIGRITALHLLERGWTVHAAARRLEAMEDLRTRGAFVHALDITEAESRQALSHMIQEHVGALDALVNNAGYGAIGPMETMPLDAARAMFEVNVFGLMGLTQALLPAMRNRGRGRIVTISSIAGQFVTPGAGWYGASKFAVEAISDALRMELQSFGVKVVVIEPGLIRTGFEAVSKPSLEAGGDDPVWGSMMRNVARAWAEGFRQGSDPEVVAACIERALTVADPSPRYRCGSSSEAALIQRFIPTRLWDAMVRRQMIGD